MKSLVIACIATAFLGCLPARAAEPFTFEAHPDIADIQAYIQNNLPVGTSRSVVRSIFVDQGGATVIFRPGIKSSEKYLYDIDMCHYYLFHWNISMDYDSKDNLRQAYIQGEPVFLDQPNDGDSHHTDPAIKVNILELVRARPQAYKGDNYIYAQVIDWNPADAGDYDKDVFVGGPTRASFPDAGHVHVYRSKLWRLIVDESSAAKTVEYQADCKSIDAQAEGRRPINVSKVIYDKLTLAGRKALHQEDR